MNATNTSQISLEQAVEAFESAWEENPDVDVRDFFPPRDHPQCDSIGIELLRVDLELRWDREDGSALENYRHQFRELLSDPKAMAQLAFEDFRLRSEAGQAVAAAAYAARYQIDVADWRLSAPSIARSLAASSKPLAFNEPSLRILKRSSLELAQQLADVSVSYPQVGDHFGDFELLEVLGTGAFATVFLARDSRLANRRVALKIAVGCTGESDRLAHLQHSHIVPVHSVHQVGPLQGICMPYLGRTTLMDLLRDLHCRHAGVPKSGQEFITTIRARGATVAANVTHSSTASKVDFNSTQASSATSARYLDQLSGLSYVGAVVWLVARIAEGLAHAHALGIIHRDIKPANILLSESGQPLILDFNVSTELSTQSSATAMVGGTLPYMSPEQLETFENGKPIDARSDIYSLGVVLFEILTGHAPYPIRRGDVAAVIESMRADRRTLPALRGLNSDVSPGLESIVHKCLEPQVSERYQSALDLAEDLDRHLNHCPLRFARESSWPERLSKWSRRHPRLASATTVSMLGAMLLAAAGSALYWKNESLHREQSQHQRHHFEERFAEMCFGLQVPDDTISTSIADSITATLQPLGVFQQERWWSTGPARYLNDVEQDWMRVHVAELLFWGSRQLLLRAPSNSTLDPSDDLRRALHWNQLAARALLTESRALGRQREAAESLLRGEPVLVTAPPRTDETLDLTSSIELYDYVDRALRVGATKSAIEALESHSGREKHDAFAWYQLGYAYLREGRFADAEVSLSCSIALDPRQLVARFYRGNVRLQRKALEAAKEDYDDVLERDSRFSGAYLNRGLVHQAMGNFSLAEADVSTAIALGTTESRAYFLRARIRRQAGDAGGAQADYTLAMGITPHDELSYLERGVHRMASDPEGALADFRAASQCNPNSTAALTNAAHVLSERLGQLKIALANMDRLVELQPEQPLWRASRAVLRARVDDRAGATDDVTAVVQQLANTGPSAESAQVWYQVSCTWSLLSRGQPSDSDRAISALGRALASDTSLANTAPQDQDLQAVASDVRFKTLLEAAQAIHNAATTATTKLPTRSPEHVPSE